MSLPAGNETFLTYSFPIGMGEGTFRYIEHPTAFLFLFYRLAQAGEGRARV